MKKNLLSLLSLLLLFTSCMVVEKGNSQYSSPIISAPSIQQSLFSDKASSISEENIQKILNGKFTLPSELKVAVINLEKKQTPNSSYWYTSDGNYTSSQQRYIDCITDKLKEQKRVKEVICIPSMMIGTLPSFTVIREAAVRLQADVVIVYSISEGVVYTNNKMFSTDHKALATTQAMIMDVRTGLVPFTDVSSKEYFIPKTDKDKNGNFNDQEKRRKTQEEATLLSLKSIGENINTFLTNR